jgi:hypothetical protein
MVVHASGEGIRFDSRGIWRVKRWIGYRTTVGCWEHRLGSASKKKYNDNDDNGDNTDNDEDV